jgi:NAD(P)-dependent dehydrogenase (short-subunit alcohol dehydrogenase family)
LASDRAHPKVVVVTGASAGLGRAIVRAFAERGASIGLIARGLDGLEATRRELEEAGCRALVLPLDVADFEAVDRAAARVEQELGPIDVWVNNAMVSVFSPVAEMRPEEYRRVTEVTYLGFVHGTLAALSRMRARDRGVIVQIGSALAYRSIPLQSAYCAAKHAIRGFTNSLRCELLHDKSGVRVVMVEMPGINTPQFDWVRSRLPGKPAPIGTVYQPEVAAEAVVWAAEARRPEVYFGAPTVQAILANTIVPRLLDRYFGWKGFEGQQRPEPKDRRAPDNLYVPLPGDHGAHGPFDAISRKSSLQLWADKRKPWILGALALLALAGVTGRRSGARSLGRLLPAR